MQHFKFLIKYNHQYGLSPAKFHQSFHTLNGQRLPKKKKTTKIFVKAKKKGKACRFRAISIMEFLLLPCVKREYFEGNEVGFQ